jgi:hypothetical protein
MLYNDVYACICIHDVYTCMYIGGGFIRACISTYMYVYACICLYLRHMPVSKSTPDWDLLECIYACIGMNLHVSYVNVYLCMYWYVFVCICIYMYICASMPFVCYMYVELCSFQLVFVKPPWLSGTYSQIWRCRRVFEPQLPQRHFITEKISFCSDNLSETLQKGVWRTTFFLGTGSTINKCILAHTNRHVQLHAHILHIHAYTYNTYQYRHAYKYNTYQYGPYTCIYTLIHAYTCIFIISGLGYT